MIHLRSVCLREKSAIKFEKKDDFVFLLEESELKKKHITRSLKNNVAIASNPGCCQKVPEVKNANELSPSIVTSREP